MQSFQIRPFNTQSYIKIIQKPTIQEQVKSILHQNSEDQQSSKETQNSQIAFKFRINKVEYELEYPIETKYNTFITKYQQKYFPGANDGNPLILILGWDPIIPQSNDSTIGETIPKTNSLLKVYTLNDFLSDIADHLNVLQERIGALQQQISQMQEQKTKNQKELNKYTEQVNQLQTEYNIQKQEYTCLEFNFQKYLQNLANNNILPNNNKILKNLNDSTLLLMAEKDEFQNQYQKLQELVSQQKYQISTGSSRIQQLQNEKLLLKEKLLQFQFQQSGEDLSQEEYKLINRVDDKIKQITLQESQQQNQQQTDIQQFKLTKQNIFTNNIQKYFSQKLNKKNQQIFRNEWSPIVPWSVDLENLQETNFYFKNQSLFQVQLYLTNHQIELQYVIHSQQQQIENLQDLIQINQSKIKIEKQKQKDFEGRYNKLRENMKLLEMIYDNYIEIINKNIIIKDNSDLLKKMKQYTIILISYKNDEEEQFQKLAGQYQLEKQQIELQAQKIHSLENEIRDLKEQIQQKQLKTVPQQQSSILISEFQSGLSQQQQYYESEQVLDRSQENNNSKLQYQIEKQYYQKQYQQFKQQYIEQQQNQIEQQSQQFEQSEQFELRQSIQQNSDLKPQISKSICTYCKQYCSEYTLLPCLHPYHQHCLEKLGKKAYIDTKHTPKCMCSEDIPIKLFTIETQHSLLKRKEEQISQDPQRSDQSRKCQNCNTYYKGNNDEQSFCPNCLK